MKVVDGTLEQIPSDYSIHLQKLVDGLLEKVPRSRLLIADILNDNPLIKEMVEKLKKGPTEEERRKEYNEQFGLTQVSSTDPYSLVGVSSVSSQNPQELHEGDLDEEERNIFDSEIIKKFHNYMKEKVPVKNVSSLRVLIVYSAPSLSCLSSNGAQGLTSLRTALLL